MKPQPVVLRSYGTLLYLLITFKYVPRINFIADIVKDCIISVGDDGLTLLFEFLQVIDDQATKESGAIFQRGFIDYDLCAFCFDSFHHTLNGALTEVVGI